VPPLIIELRMKQDKNTLEFYTRLKQQLSDDTSWPAPYLYKFIVPADLEKIAEIEAIFNDTNAVIQTRDSSKGTYTSVSIKVKMASPEAVIEKYLEVSNVEGVISL
jgi:putative lipoic acid-binding regulatory protein